MRVDNGSYNPHPLGASEWKSEATYEAWKPDVGPEDVQGRVLRLGAGSFETSWRVVGVEQIAIRHILLTLRGVSLIGVIPELASKILDKDGNAVNADTVHGALGALVDALHKQQATPIVDVARETAKVVLTAWIGPDAHGRDLAKVIALIPAGRDLAKWAAYIVNRLHPRGKSSERESVASKGVSLRPVINEDAESSVHLIGLLLREIGWAAQ
jgi:hypothetical protein